MDSSESSYTYEPLPKGKYIRVLDLLPAELMESPVQLKLRAVLVQCPMASEDAYEALSYVWGTGDVAGLVYCGGKGIGVTANCLTALTYLRRRRKVRTLWVDAICINQAGPTEGKKPPSYTNERRLHPSEQGVDLAGRQEGPALVADAAARAPAVVARPSPLVLRP